LTKGMQITPTQLMNIKPGRELDALVTAHLDDFVTIDNGCDPNPLPPAWSTDKKEALWLMETIEEHVSQVGILLLGADAPIHTDKMATVGDEGEATMVFTGSWMESLSKAFILYQHGNTGEYFDPRFTEKMQSAPKKVLQ